MPQDPGEGGRGAYGLSIEGWEGLDPWLVAAPAAWPAWRLRWEAADVHPVPQGDGGYHAWLDRLTDEQARITLARGGRIELDRSSATATMHLAAPPPHMEVIHPLLSAIGSTVARWHGRYEVHAGGLCLDDGVWALLGDKGAGKSSLLAWCLLNERATVIADDLLIVDQDGSALAGPRCLDLRADVAEHLGIGKPIGRIGGRNRWRVHLAEAPARLPLAGWIQLAWSEALETQVLSPSETFAAVARNLAVKLMPSDVGGLMQLSDLPAVRVTRPRSYDATDSTGEQLLEAVRAARG